MSDNNRIGALPHVMILGGGVIGLSIAWRLAQKGCKIDLIDAGSDNRISGSASWASAGLLAPNVEAEPTENSLHELCIESRSEWPEFVAELESFTSMSVGYKENGILCIAHNRDDVKKLEHIFEWHSRLGTVQNWLFANQVAELEPNLAATAIAARYLPHDGNVNPRMLVMALKKAVSLMGVKTHCKRIERICVESSRPSLFGDNWNMNADILVIATGAWSRDLPGLPDIWRPPVRPVKGQMLAVRLPDGSPMLNHPVFTPKVYLVPQESGRLLIGATVEDRGFDATVTAGGVLHLLEGAWRALPVMESALLEETWAGLRPGSRDDAPYLGHRSDQLVFAAGHYRNGILLTPITARTIAQAVVEGRDPECIRAFAPNRFDNANAI